MARIAVFGATGFVGAAFVERLLGTEQYEVRSIIHRTGNAWRLARRGLQLVSVDLRDAAAVRAALVGIDYVVNCTRGSRDVMLGGLDTLLRESRRAGVARFVHLSSVSVWGDRTPGTVLAERDAASDALTRYGAEKAEQDRRVAAACRAGLPAVILAPPMIGGPASPFLLQVVNALRRDTLALIDGGNLPCSLCDVRNVAYALELALHCERADATPYLLTDESEIDWGELVRALLPLAEKTEMPPTISREEALARLPAPRPPRLSPAATARALARALCTPQSRALLKQDALLGAAYGLATQRLPEEIARWVRATLRSGGGSGERDQAFQLDFDAHLLTVQTRAVRHRLDGARDLLGYRSRFASTESIADFVRWQDRLLGRDSADWPLLRELWQPIRPNPSA